MKAKPISIPLMKHCNFLNIFDALIMASSTIVKPNVS